MPTLLSVNFRHIHARFGCACHIWGASGYVEKETNKSVRKFIPMKFVRDLYHISSSITLVGQDFNNPDDFYQDSFKTTEIFYEREPQ